MTLSTGSNRSGLRDIINRISHYLPTQGPLDVFVHHNTLHAFEEYHFLEGVEKAASVYGARAYQSEFSYQRSFIAGRINDHDLREAILLDQPSLARQNEEVASDECAIEDIRAILLSAPEHTTRESVFWALLEHGGLDHHPAELAFPRWEGEIARERAIVRAMSLAERSEYLDQYIERHEYWNKDDELVVEELTKLLERPVPDVNRTALRMLWLASMTDALRMVRLETRLDGMNADTVDRAARELTMPLITKLAAAYVDDGVAAWQLPRRKEGFVVAVSEVLQGHSPLVPWFVRGVGSRLTRLVGRDPLDALEDILREEDLAQDRWEEVLQRELLELKGWAGFFHLLETHHEILPTSSASREDLLIQFLAVSMIIRARAREVLRDEPRAQIRPHGVDSDDIVNRLYYRAFHLFRWCQVRGVTARTLVTWPAWRKERLFSLFASWEVRRRERVWHLAFEGNFERRVYHAFLAGVKHAARPASIPHFQIITCIDDREESFRRYLEEMGRHVVTFGTAGFFGVDVAYQSIEGGEAPFCPVVIRPRHVVVERAKDEHLSVVDRRLAFGRTLIRSRGMFDRGSRSAMGGALASLLGGIAFVPMLMRTLFPRLSGRISGIIAGREPLDTVTDIVYEREEGCQADEFSTERLMGFSPVEMAQRVGGLLRSIGLVNNFAPIVVLFGHGSSSRNNPFRSAYDCGACGGRPGRVNARVFALMANRQDVRRLLRESGIDIPDSTHFLGGYHDTSSDSISYFDTDSIPAASGQFFEELRFLVDEARRRNARERCRRFAYAPHDDRDAALAHVEGRTQSIAEPRPEYGHATNAIAIIGPRNHSRGVFFDRRSFLVSYEPSVDPEASILTAILAAVVPVCMGINLEYFFSSVDNEVYGAGSKLPMNIASLVGVITGFASDLRTGLPAQMVEIHEPVRLNIIIESRLEQFEAALGRLPVVRGLIEREWVKVALYDPVDHRLFPLIRGRVSSAYDAFEALVPEVHDEESLISHRSGNLPFVSVHQSMED